MIDRPAIPAIADLVDLSGRAALVTGGARGIGRAIATRLIEAGTAVTVADLNAEGARVAAELGAEFAECDVSDTSQVKEAVQVAATDGRLDILVNNAGIFPTTGPITEVDDDFVSRMLDVNVRSQFSMTREAAAVMGTGGAIVNMASVAGLSGGAGISAYSASKAAMVSLTQASARELGPRGIRVNAVAPGIIETPGVEAQLAPLKEAGLDIEARIVANPLRMAGQPDHVARVVLFLASDLAAFITGTIVRVDGGSNI